MPAGSRALPAPLCASPCSRHRQNLMEGPSEWGEPGGSSLAQGFCVIPGSGQWSPVLESRMKAGPTALPGTMAADWITPNPEHTEPFGAACWPVGISHAGALVLQPPTWGLLPSPLLEPGVQALRALLPAPFLLSAPFLLCSLSALHPSCPALFLPACLTSVWAGLAGYTPFPPLAWPFVGHKLQI